MADLFTSTTTYEDNSKGKSGSQAELEEFVMVEKQKAQFNAQIHEFNELCWEKCMDKPGSKIDSRTEACLTNCVDRFIDVSLLISNRFAQLLQKSAGGM
ncbi:mitochondrial import inner membrane translocase subunit Tim8-like [Athalia rosae]|uniref:mitochondrial import inner membrane translocase subunit Tim8-like n=1 Tax=Athalia rosae TaxID=37344 RepID=UPI000624F436|nr:mitochondrial import inner membrane translocase subunit Tim8-like [Athalia rosae]XP_012268218.1 mitochondrial import inner membrane translocase subunit Tim8-like [Athalia rosae]XP_048511299.1 mitochondrial import inner membrane translocase subunit Tim8-like [Athalia rosae]XP_048511300.1 mitochondrial import inner membrane translocase subunit Tim8-like [Athalia rosae]XP_048511301.1 mitochondrial import inner membrane translocase subunit Tim8-like [Athalia rosae]